MLARRSRLPARSGAGRRPGIPGSTSPRNRGSGSRGPPAGRRSASRERGGPRPSAARDAVVGAVSPLDLLSPRRRTTIITRAGGHKMKPVATAKDTRGAGKPPAEAADPRRVRPAFNPVTGLFVLACLYTVYFARPVLLPLTLGLILDFLLRPAVRALRRLHLPESAGAALVIVALLVGVTFGLYVLCGTALFDAPADRGGTRASSRETQQQVSSYLHATTGVNAAFGVVAAASRWPVGMPNALLWGMIAGVTSFIPSMGGLVSAVLIGL